MSGTRGRSGGANRKPVALHARQGTFRADRHTLATVGATARAAAPAVPSPALLAGLEADGAHFLAACFTEYEPTVVEARLLRLAADMLDDARAARLRGEAKEERAAIRTLLGILQRLNFPLPEGR